MDTLIENPKVFISYAWGTEEYQQKVLDFASRLKGDGISVIIDKWSMEVGNDTFSFMEKCVKDASIHFVIILLDPVYAKKADDRSGGVGAETQIISPNVYNDTEQSKFVPIVFERGKNNEICKPVYLNGRLHFDLTTADYKSEYIKLVRHLYGRKTYIEPPLGRKPSWVDTPKNIIPLNLQEIVQLKNNVLNFNNSTVVFDAFNKILKSLDTILLDDKALPSEINANTAKTILSYKASFIPVRDNYLELLDIVALLDNIEDEIVDFLLNIYNKYKSANIYINKELLNSLLNELFIYTISKLWKVKAYTKIYNILTRTYFPNTVDKDTATFKEIFYCSEFEMIDLVKNKNDYPNDERKYYSGEAQLWIETINEKYSKEDFIFADLLLHNLSLLLTNSYWDWFPKTYVYGDRYTPNSQFRLFCLKFKSKYELKKISTLLGTKEINQIKSLFDKMQEIKDGPNERYKYSSAFDRADLILDFIKIEDIGTLN